jgi:hypothetical protein
VAPWRDVMRESMQPMRRATLKMAVSAFVALIASQILGYPAVGALFAALSVSLQASSGTAISKSLLILGGLLVGLAVMMMIVVPLMPILEDPGSFLVLAAIAFAPVAWLLIAGARVRNAGLFATVIVAISLFAGFRPSVDLEPPARFALDIAIGVLVVGAVDRVVWPVDARRGMWQHAAWMMREAAILYRQRDPRAVVAPNSRWRFHLYRHLVSVIQLRSERVPQPGSPAFEPKEEALRIARSTQWLVVARIEEARREMAGVAPPPSPAELAAVAARLDERAAELERRARAPAVRRV